MLQLQEQVREKKKKIQVAAEKNRKLAEQEVDSLQEESADSSLSTLTAGFNKTWNKGWGKSGHPGGK